VKQFALVSILFVTSSALANAGADEHLLAGAREFRAENYSAALVEFRVAERLGGGAEAAGYAAAALVKLDRAEEAVETFASTGAPGRDPLLDYYRALACYGAQLYVCADKLLALVGSKSGPRIAEHAQATRETIATLLEREPSAESIDWYFARAAQARRSGRTALAEAFEEEGQALAARRSARAHVAEENKH
jgi:hypothetical protein